MIKGWRYYNHAILPDCAPHKTPDISMMKKKKFWEHDNGKAIMSRWTSNFDCGMETKWWYIIKDDIYDISALKSKRRYEINKGKKNFSVEIINPKNFISQLIDIQKKAYEQYPLKYRPKVNEEKFIEDINSWGENTKIFGAFSVEDSSLCGYAMIIEFEEYANFAMLKVIPNYEKLGVNAAIISGILENYNSKLVDNYYICDGERALLHETNFQDYLEKYFGFRKAFCKLNVKYRFPISFIILLFTPFEKFLSSKNGIIAKLKVLIKYKIISEE
ncbi:TPA: hypothetical protein I9081_001804 [Clostridium perfringens]|uniref:hypothetical protein n=1 Tax=Clostridium perfringens TaxID=1502 RepID=UPI001A2DCA3D|nr:hypothetical protein [Clostridium perfringens]EJT6151356.1 hypothetical protein [Clostridium perfringens]EJT6157041.1 hypothetical protein [Clostridium perfringens]ELC8344933.1 hypothetical protein [Clostridium perfringens]MDM0457524.1 hypothetical protein [Clostridium perfringens]MDU3663588.1 hypothetical protein [Clostridium perfringens]